MASNPTDNQDAPVVLAEPFLFGILGLGILNGIFSPFTGFVFLVHAFWYPRPSCRSPAPSSCSSQPHHLDLHDHAGGGAGGALRAVCQWRADQHPVAVDLGLDPGDPLLPAVLRAFSAL
jgi:hypothetical protein